MCICIIQLCFEANPIQQEYTGPVEGDEGQASAFQPKFDHVVELPMLEDSTEDFVDEFGRMNGSASNIYELAPRRRTPPVSRPRLRSRSRSPRPSSVQRSSVVGVRNSAFGSGVLITDYSEFEAAYNTISRRIRCIIASGAAFYIGITEDPAVRWGSDHCFRWEFLEILAQAPTSYTTASLEMRLLGDFRHVLTCENNSDGGEGASRGSPHFCYVCVRCNGLLRRRTR